MPWNHLAELTLAHRDARLRLLTADDRDDLARIVFDESIWRYFVSRVDSEAALDRFIDSAVADSQAGRRIVFAIVDPATGRVAGSTAYGNLAPADARLEIGWSWVAPSLRRAGLNRAVKLLLLDHAFDVLKAERVEFKTDVLNEGARRGLEGIGAKEEGVLRSFNVMPGGRRRDAIYFSILRHEWPEVRATRFARQLVDAPAMG